MGSFLSQIMGKLLGDGKPPESNCEIDGNICICCGTLNVANVKNSSQEKIDDDEDFFCR